ncbi:MAG: ABC transporter [Actinobacteria bacterium RBG_19FT_COMBO_54_7]|uniref:Transport permease protein n=1 Tax=Candidatus Solincola sediminis TaxID=1797199 RepID=A0A1F2WTE7_9ACTN|nr:MAG: ABC transporter [Candidatus Solincola sediminis]OFW60966.1 MAG: ABC transporter [Candidatus Solincola sediminis]OFW69031.1 MAG: ABC transporter [Actinobacteria bacterium RBG_19FT_COMBO_54_7]
MPPRQSFLVGAVRDTAAVARRNLIGLYRVPQLLIFVLVQPVIFVVLFRYVFGGALALAQVTPYPYVDFLMPGIFVQTVVFGAIGTAIGITTDIQSGMLERFRALPMRRTAFLTGRTLSDLVRNMAVMALITGVGFAVGFRIHTNPIAFTLGILLVLLFAYVLSWLFALEGLLLRDPESAQAAAFPVMAPLVFASSAFIPVTTMPSWLQGFAKYQPVSVTASAVRALVLGGPTANYVLQSLAWCAGIVAVCAPLAVWYYRRAV